MFGNDGDIQLNSVGFPPYLGCKKGRVVEKLQPT